MKRKLTACLLTVCLLVCLMLCGCGADSSFTHLDAKNGVAAVYFKLRAPDGSVIPVSGGSGFFVGPSGQNPEYLITNHHVVDSFISLGSGEWVEIPVQDGTLTVKGLLEVHFGANDSVQATVIDYNATSDVAILRLAAPTDKRIPLALLEPTEDMVGSQVYGIGFPGLSDNLTMDAVSQNGLQDMTVTSGTISRLLTSTGSGVQRIQTDMVIQHGNSGGPMVTSQGQVVGINSWGILDPEAMEQNYYACNISEAIFLLNRNNVPYTLANDGGFSVSIPLLLGIVLVLALAVAAVLLLQRRKIFSKQQSVTSSVDESAVPVPPSPVDSGYRIQCTSGALAGQRYMIRTADPLVLGRNKEFCNIVFPNTPGVSGKHCTIWHKHGKIYLQDLGSTHGTFLMSGAKLAVNQPVELKVGDGFCLGSSQESFVIAEKRGH